MFNIAEHRLRWAITPRSRQIGIVQPCVASLLTEFSNGFDVWVPSSPMTPAPSPDGQAALMLCESLVLLLIETGVVTERAALDAIDGIIEVKREIAGVQESVVVSMESIILLRRVRESVSAACEPSPRIAL